MHGCWNETACLGWVGGAAGRHSVLLLLCKRKQPPLTFSVLFSLAPAMLSVGFNLGSPSQAAQGHYAAAKCPAVTWAQCRRTRPADGGRHACTHAAAPARVRGAADLLGAPAAQVPPPRAGRVSQRQRGRARARLSLRASACASAARPRPWHCAQGVLLAHARLPCAKNLPARPLAHLAGMYCNYNVQRYHT